MRLGLSLHLSVVLLCGSAAACEGFTGTGGAGGTGSASTSSGGSVSAGGSAPCSATTCVAGKNATASCEKDACVYKCKEGFGDCDSDPSTCETDLTQPSSCGACGNVCATECLSQADGCNDATALVAGDYHTCALRKDGTVWCWGANYLGQVGDESGINTVLSPSRTKITPKITQLSANADTTCGVSEDLGLFCWGDRKDSNAAPIDQSANFPQTTGVTVGSSSFAIATAYEMADGPSLVITNQSLDTFTPVIVGAGQDTQVIGAFAAVAGYSHRCAAVATPKIVCWGEDSSGQLGDGQTTTSVDGAHAVTVGVDSLATPISIAAGQAHTCVASSGSVTCWGANENGQLGVGSSNAFESSPKIVQKIGDVPSVVRAGRSTTAVITKNGGLYLWGRNDSHQIDSTPNNATAPKKFSLTDTSPVVDVAVGDSHVCALLRNGKIYCWGDNTYGQLGNGASSPTPPSKPTPTEAVLP